MAFIPFSRTVKAEMVYSQDGQVVENVLHFQREDPVTTSNMFNLAGDLKTWWNTSVRPLVSNKVSLNTIRVTDLTTQISPGIEYTTGLPLTGAITLGAMPNNVTLSVKLITALRGRAYRGRIYHVGLYTTVVTDNTITAAHQTALTSAYVVLTLPSSYSGYTFGVASRQIGGAPRTDGVITPVTGMTINRTIDSQRRRLPERGR